jgi:hypothetical protein
MIYYHLKNLHRRLPEIVRTVLQRLCITVRRRAIALTYYFEAAGS